jgi:hypothetical protein
MALPRHPSGVDTQVPNVRGRLFRDVHRHRRFRLNRPMDPNFNAGVLSDLVGISCGKTLACPVASNVQYCLTEQPGATVLKFTVKSSI